MSQSTGTRPSDTSASSESSNSPALAYVNPQPRLPGSEAAPPQQPETFMRRARRVQLGSHRLKLWYLALCTFGRAWTRDSDMLELGIKQRTLAGELETRLNVVSRTLGELRETGLVQVFRKKYHSTIRIFLTPQGQSDTPQGGVSGGSRSASDTPLPGVPRVRPVLSDTPQGEVTGAGTRDSDTPRVGVADTPQGGVTKVFRSSTDDQQQQHVPPSAKQLRGIASMAAELGVDTPEPADRLEADATFRELRNLVDVRRTTARRARGRRSEGSTNSWQPRRWKCEQCGTVQDRQPDSDRCKHCGQ